MKSPPVGGVSPSYIQPQANLLLLRLNAPASSSVLQTGFSMAGQQLAGQLSTDSWKKHLIGYRLLDGESSGAIPTSENSIETDLPAPSPKGESEKPIGSSAIEYGDGTDENGKILTGVNEFDGRPIRVVTPEQMIQDIKDTTNPILGIWPRLTNIFDAFIQGIHRATYGAGIPLEEGV